MTGTDDLACRRALDNGSRSFAAAARLLPRGMRRSATALYAFCRAADDAVDLGDAGAALASLHVRLAACYAGQAQADPADRAFADLVARHAVPMSLPAALLEGFAWDAEGRRYDSLEALLDYAMRVAGSVGAMMAILMGVRDRDALSAACELGCAMQLTNIARDVGEDARANRLYLPLDWLREAGLDPDAFLAAPVFGPALGVVVARLLAEAATHYRRASAGIARLPLSCRPAIRAASLLYAGIGGEIERRGYDTVSQRAVVPTRHKVALLPRLLLPSPSLPASYRFDPAACLLDSLPQSQARRSHRSPLQRADDRLAWTLELFERLGRLEQQS